MYPSHESQTRPQSPSTAGASPENQHGVTSRITARSVCAALQLSRATYNLLMEYYFTNMTAFTLFRPGSIELKFAMMQHHSDAEALVASMFCFSARYCRDDDNCPSPSQFAQIASLKLDESIDHYGDMPPPLWLLQASVLISFYQLTVSVRSRSWKKLGDCIRYAYDMNLHLVDANHDPAAMSGQATVDIPRWLLLEERRRAWWAVWEMDVFASTIRRLPTAIDASLNLTMLPVPDDCWFSDQYQESCFLAEDSSLRWKHLAQSGNRSAKAWFIVVNSLMRNTQRVVYPAGPVMQSRNGPNQSDHNDELNIMANTLYCTIASLPADLGYQGETLDFRVKHALSSDGDNSSNPRQRHADIYSIHLMTQLCRFMVYHHRICARAPWLAQRQQGPADRGERAGPPATQQANSEWSNYINASEEIVIVVRNSARDHFRYVNPFLTNTLWFAAAAQVACNVFGPASLNRRLASSNLDLLKLTIEGFISFWGGMESLRGKLARIETGLQNLMSRPNHSGSREEPATAPRHQRRATRHPTTQDAASTAAAGEESSGTVGLTDNLTQIPPGDRGVSLHHDAAEVGAAPVMAMPHNVNADPTIWADPRWSALGPELYGFTPQFHTPTPGQAVYPVTTADTLDFSPFGLEELLMGGIME
ncbi:fungal-specific transcription factor domain-containing protein [Chaetomium tenue]|uniref:Fungal-specific transcription factor domain-containing protein n=1 Tax=Chaetomium tenue TaxID=1854479 RepID=A0ACB7PK22_9PEZI|nr:fungal-specific transcription factor domain-containing protein [Chaetomium globosum]